MHASSGLHGPTGRHERLAGDLTTEDALPLPEAVKALKAFDGTKFDQSVEIAIRLGIDNSQAEQLIRGSIVLPHGIGKQQRRLPVQLP